MVDWLMNAVQAAEARGLRLVMHPPATEEAIREAEAVLGPLPPDPRAFYQIADGGTFGILLGTDDHNSGVLIFKVAELAEMTRLHRYGYNVEDVIAFGNTPGTGEGFLALDSRSQVLEILLYSTELLAPDFPTFLRRVLECPDEFYGLYWIPPLPPDAQGAP